MGNFWMLSPICEKTSVLVGGSGGASYDLGSISGWQARMPTAIRPTYSTPDPLRLRPVKRATKRPIDRGQCNWWSSTACGQDPAIVANLPLPRRSVDFSFSGGSKMVEPTITLLEIPSRDGWSSSSTFHDSQAIYTFVINKASLTFKNS